MFKLQNFLEEKTKKPEKKKIKVKKDMGKKRQKERKIYNVASKKKVFYFIEAQALTIKIFLKGRGFNKNNCSGALNYNNRISAQLLCKSVLAVCLEFHI